MSIAERLFAARHRLFVQIDRLAITTALFEGDGEAVLHLQGFWFMVAQVFLVQGQAVFQKRNCLLDF